MTSFDHQSGTHLHIQGADFYYEQTGNPNGPPLLLLHGGLGTMEDFNKILFSLDLFRIGIDSRGHGKSTLRGAPPSYKQLQHGAEAVVKHLKLEAVTIIGFSDRGAMATATRRSCHPTLSNSKHHRSEPADQIPRHLRAVSAPESCARL